MQRILYHFVKFLLLFFIAYGPQFLKMPECECIQFLLRLGCLVAIDRYKRISHVRLFQQSEHSVFGLPDILLQAPRPCLVFVTQLCVCDLLGGIQL